MKWRLQLLPVATGAVGSPRKWTLHAEDDDSGVYFELDEHDFSMLMSGQRIELEEV